MKKFTNITCTITATLILMSGCSSTNSIATPEAEAEAAVASFFDDITDNSIGEFEEYFASDSSEYTEYERLTDIYAVSQAFVSGADIFTNAFDEDETEDWANNIVSKAYKSFDYEITACDANDTSAQISVNLTLPSITADVNDELLLADAFGFDVNDSMTLIYKAAEKNGMDAADFAKELSDTPPNRIMSEMAEVFSDELDTYASSVIEKRLETPQVISVTASLEKQPDGVWKISELN